jgi:hypothetical protein
MSVEDRLDKSAFSFTTLEQADADDVAFWLSKSPAERIDGVEHLRRWLYGEDQVDAGLQRVFELAQLGGD